MRFLPRARGALLRLVRRRRLAFVVGLLLLIPSAWVEFGGRFASWLIDGMALIGLASGAALVWHALVGASPDWIE
jgi:hypothetical protein